MTAPTLSEFFAQQSGWLRMTVKEGTWRAYSAGWSHRVEPTLGAIRLDELTPWLIESAYGSWTGTRSTKIDAVAILSRTLKRAVRAGYITANPVASCEFPKPAMVDPVGRALTDAEFMALLDHIRVDSYRRPVKALYHTGLRFGEMAGLDKASVDLRGRLIHVNRQFTPGLHGAMVATSPKSNRTRVAPIVDELVPVLEAAMKDSTGSLVFVGPSGGILSGKNMARATKLHDWRREVKDYGPGAPAFHWHDLRHTFAVNCFKAGMPAPSVQAILGHSSLAVTQLYARASDQMVLDAGRQLSVYRKESKG